MIKSVVLKPVAGRRKVKTRRKVVIIFDGYKVEGGKRRFSKFSGELKNVFFIVFTFKQFKHFFFTIF